MSFTVWAGFGTTHGFRDILCSLGFANYQLDQLDPMYSPMFGLSLVNYDIKLFGTENKHKGRSYEVKGYSSQRELHVSRVNEGEIQSSEIVAGNS